MPHDDACPYCQINDGHRDAAKIYRNAATIAMLSDRPQARGHAIVFPRAHFQNIYQIDPAAAAETMETARRIAKAVRRTLEPDGITIAQMNGAIAGQDAPHFHMHIIPRFVGEPLRGPARTPVDLAELRRLAARIASHMRR